MANEFTYAPNVAALTLVVKVYTAAGAQVGTDVAATETGPLYIASMPAAAEGIYTFLYFEGTVQVSEIGQIDWDGTQERQANTLAPDNVSIAAILVDTNELQTNQGNWLTADVSAILADTNELQTNQGNWVTADVSGILADTNELQLNQGNWLTAIPDGFYTYFTAGVRADAFKADVSGIPTSTAPSANDIYVEFTTGTNADAFKAIVTDLVDILADTNELQLNQGNWVTVDITGLETSTDAILIDTADLQANQGGWLTATGFSTHSAADVLSVVVEGTETLAESTKIMRAALAGDVLMDGAIFYFKAIDGTTNRITSPTNEFGERTGVTTDGT